MFLCGLYLLLGWPMNGSWSILLSAQLLMVIACQGIAALFFLLLLDPTKAMSFAAGFTAPAFAFAGVTFPATDMSLPAQVWRSLLPVTHYLEIQAHQVNHGQSLAEAATSLAVLAVMALTLIPALLRCRSLAIADKGDKMDRVVRGAEQ